MKSIPGHDEVELVEKQLFQSLSRDEPPVKAKHVAAAALGLGSAALTSATAAEGAAVGSAILKAGPFVLLKWVGIGTVAGVASIGAIRYAMPTSPAMAPRAIATVAAGPAPQAPAIVPGPAPAARATTPTETTPSEPTLDPVAQPLRAARPAAAPALRASSASAVANDEPAALAANALPATHPLPAPNPAPLLNAPSTLPAEVAMLDQARSAVDAKSGERALDVLGRYARQFPSGTLALEATVLRIEALFLTGASPAATTLAHDFLAAHPTSTHATRVRRLLAEHQKP